MQLTHLVMMVRIMMLLITIYIQSTHGHWAATIYANPMSVLLAARIFGQYPTRALLKVKKPTQYSLLEKLCNIFNYINLDYCTYSVNFDSF